jgi:hypothetical protein
MAETLIEWEIPSKDDGAAGNYFGSIYRSGSESWATKIAGAGVATLTNLASVYVGPNATVADEWELLTLADIVIDMTGHTLLTITNAKLWAYCSQRLWRNDPWALAANNKFVVCEQMEDVRGLDIATVNYAEIIQGANQPMSMYSDTTYDMDGDYEDTWMSWDFNATGLAYLNGIGTKANMKTTAFFSIVPYGIVAGHAPAWSAGVGSKNTIWWDSVWLSLYYDNTAPPMQIVATPNAYKSIASGQINVGGVWKDIVGVQVSVDETWETVK